MLLYNMPDSGNCYKVRLLCAHLGLSYERVDIDPVRPETRPAELRELNPAGRAPTLVLDDGKVLPESNAILTYLADGTPYLPDDRYERARVLGWLFFEQNLHEPNIATRRFWVALKKDEAAVAGRLEAWLAGGRRALEAMDGHLAAHPWFGPGTYSIADIALFAYTHVAEEGGFALEPYEHVRGWLRRVVERPAFEPMAG